MIKRFNSSNGDSKRPYKRNIYVFTEGAVTERDYFKIVNDLFGKDKYNIKHISKKNKSSANHVLNRIRTFLKDNNLRPNDEIWAVIDRDRWSENDINELVKWSGKDKRFKLAISNRNFEYWLLLHFEDGHNIKSEKDCEDRLKKRLPKYNKSLSIQHFSEKCIKEAANRSELKYRSCEGKVVTTRNTTNVHLLLKDLIF